MAPQRRSTRHVDRQIHEENLVRAISAGWLNYKRNIDILANGVSVTTPEGTVYQRPPDLRANIYMIERVIGKIPEATPPGTNQASPLFAMLAKILNRHTREPKPQTDKPQGKKRPKSPGKVVRRPRG
jgi:hypothetical protein